MEIVVDASVLIAVIADEPVRERLVEVTRGADLIAPPSVHWEIGNAFSSMLKRKRISLHDLLSALEAYQGIVLRLAEVELADSLRLAAELGIYAYDAYVLRCALKYGAPLLSLDEQMVCLARKKHILAVEVRP